jgi:serine/threonine protein kinase
VTSASDPAGRLVADRYEIVRPLGRGSFGHTFLADDRVAQRPVAIKILHPRDSNDWKAHELFERESAVLRSLRHHGIPEVHDVVRADWDGASASILVLEYVDGVSLEQVIGEQRQLDPVDVIHMLLALLGILEYLHGRIPPILHRDIKPANIIIRPDASPALVDFGSVRRVFLGPEEGGSTVAGTYGYMPYEQYMGQASPASDLYALGATFLHLLTGRPPRDFMTHEGRIQVPESLPDDLRLRAVLAQMLLPSPTERFASAREVRYALLSPAALQPAGARPRPAPRLESTVGSLGAAPRTLEGATTFALDRVAPTVWEFMDTSTKPTERTSILDLLSLAAVSVLTAGVYPLVFLSIARSRRRRLRHFFTDGHSTTAEVLNLQTATVAFDQKLVRVSYEFEADGQRHRDVDQILPTIADRWRPGDRVQILYLPAEEYDSVIISTT